MINEYLTSLTEVVFAVDLSVDVEVEVGDDHDGRDNEDHPDPHLALEEGLERVRVA